MKIVSRFLILLPMLLVSVSGSAETFDQNSAVLTNPYMPWNVGAEFTLVGTGDAAGISLRFRCLTVESIGGVSCLKVETVDFGRANLRTYWWLAQDTDGNIWQLQQSDEQFDGSFETESGEWLYVPATFTLGESLELYGAYADVYTVVSLTGTAPTPYRMFTSCVVTELSEFGQVEQHFIAPGFGPVRATFSGLENGSFELQSVSGFNPPAQQSPVFAVHPNDQTIVEGEAAVFIASASGNPTPTYQWKRRSAGSAAWSDLATVGSYSGVMSATLSVSGTTLAMSGDQFRCIAINAAGSAISNPATLTVLPRPTLRITRIWSDQVPDIQFNSLPPEASHGAGNWGNSLSLILMGARAEDDRGHVKCSIELDPPDSPLREKLVLRLVRLDGPGGNLADAVVNGETATFSTEVPGNVISCRIEGWVDLDDNGQFDSDSGETLTRAPGLFVIVSRAGYQAAISELRSKTWHGLAGAVLPTAYRFLDSFLNGGVPEHATDNGFVSISAINDLDHNVGVQFGLGVVANAPEYQFGHHTDVANKVLASEAIRTAAFQAIAANRVAIDDTFQNPHTNEMTIPLAQGADPLSIEFQPPSHGSWSGWDLYYAFHFASLYQATITIKRDRPNSVSLRGTLTDTYDFRWNVGDLSSLACRVQAGFPSLGNAGGVFRVRVLLDGEVPNIRYDLEPSLHLLWSESSNGTGLVLECTHAPGSSNSIEYSTDLKSWQLLQDLSSTESVTTVNLKDFLESNSECYFRVVE